MVCPDRHSCLTWAFELKDTAAKFLLVQTRAFLEENVRNAQLPKLVKMKWMPQGMRRDCAILIDITYQLILSDELIKA